MSITRITSCVLGMLLLLNGLPAQEEETIREEVSVVNIEVPVRVYLDGKPVDNLSKQDFEIYEGRQRQEINGFFIKRKKIKIPDTGVSSFNQQLPSRYFVLAFHIREFNDHLEKGLRYIFENMMYKNDRLMVFVAGKTLLFNDLAEKEKCLEQVSSCLKIQADEARARMLRLRSTVRNNPLFNVPGNSRLKNSLDAEFELVYDYLKRYERILLDYKKKYLMPEITGFYNFANHLDTIDMEKWVINFYQEESYPHLGPAQKKWINDLIDELMAEPEHKSTYSQMLHTLLLRVERELNAANSFPVEDINKFFTRTGVTFHSLLIPLVNPQSFQFSSGFHQMGFEYKKISTDFENSLRELTKNTGGTLAYSGNLVKSLHRIEEQEDICYWLTFSPQHPDKTAKVEVKVRGPGYKLIYDNNIQPDYLRAFTEKRDIRFENVSFTMGTLRLQVTGFQLQRDDKKGAGRISLRIRIIDDKNNNLFDQEKMMWAEKENIDISIPFTWLPSGQYSIIVDAKDLFTGKSISKLLKPVVGSKTINLRTGISVSVGQFNNR